MKKDDDLVLVAYVDFDAGTVRRPTEQEKSKVNDNQEFFLDPEKLRKAQEDANRVKEMMQ